MDEGTMQVLKYLKKTRNEHDLESLELGAPTKGGKSKYYFNIMDLLLRKHKQEDMDKWSLNEYLMEVAAVFGEVRTAMQAEGFGAEENGK